MEHIGIDLHKKDSQICILAEGGALLEHRIRTDPRRFAEVLSARLRPPRTSGSRWISRDPRHLERGPKAAALPGRVSSAERTARSESNQQSITCHGRLLSG